MQRSAKKYTLTDSRDTLTAKSKMGGTNFHALLAFLVLSVAVLVASTSGVASAGAADLSYASNDSTAATNATVENVTFSESAANTTNEGHPVIWQGQSFETTVEYDPPDKSGYEVCLWADTSEVQSCKTVNLGDPANRTSVTFELSEWPTDENGKVALSTELRFDGETLDSSTTEVVVLPENGSYDGDSLQNTEELGMNSSVLSADTDNDGLRDGREIELATDPTDPDSDDDGLRDARELELGTDPTEKDTDDDGLTDGREAELGTDPTEKDTDDDGLTDSQEIEHGTDPTEKDTDDDGLTDSQEMELGTDPTEKDTDGDGLTDGREVELGTDPTEKDTDGDGLSDDTEVTYGTNPTSSKSPFTVAVGVVVTGVAGIIFATRRFDGGLFQWRANDRSILSFPARSGHSESPSQEQQDADEEPATETQQAETPGVAANRAIDPDRERVLRILQESGGRIRQRQVVDETDWSASKVSRRLSKMEDDGLISKVTIGRENIVMLDDEDHGADFDET